MDMLIVGMHGKGNVGLAGCSDVQYQTHYALWAFLGSPLMIGCDIREMSDETRRILMNDEMIRINQDPLCRQPYKVKNHAWNDKVLNLCEGTRRRRSRQSVCSISVMKNHVQP